MQSLWIRRASCTYIFNLSISSKSSSSVCKQFQISSNLNKTFLLLCLHLKLFLSLSLSLSSVNIIKWVMYTYNLHLLTSHSGINPQPSGFSSYHTANTGLTKITHHLPLATSNYLSITFDLLDHSLFLEVFISFFETLFFSGCNSQLLLCYTKVAIPKSQWFTLIKVSFLLTIHSSWGSDVALPLSILHLGIQVSGTEGLMAEPHSDS